jgi:hypothetical protein
LKVKRRRKVKKQEEGEENITLRKLKEGKLMKLLSCIPC